MPLYEYRCTQCAHQFEKIQTFSAPDVKECPVCQGPVERLISAPAVHFSGSGFYQTDYKGKAKNASATAGSGSSSAASSSSEGGASSSGAEASSAAAKAPAAGSSSSAPSGGGSSAGNSSPSTSGSATNK